MEGIPGPIFLLAAYWLMFWWGFLKNPFRLCTSELASTFFPFWYWSKGRISFKSNIYYEYPACIPFLSSFYPTHLITSFLSRFLGPDNAFILFIAHILGHYLLGSVMAYYALLGYGETAALFGALTLTYSAYFIKPLTPCAVYTHAWVLGAIGGGSFGAFCLGMAILGGYWPTLVYILPVLLIWHPETSWGVLLGLPQIIPFLWYWPRSVRAGVKPDDSGKVPLWRFLDLFFPDKYQNSINGVFWPEMAMYMGIAPLLIWKASWWWLPLLSAFLITTSILPGVQRISARALYLLTFSVAFLTVPDVVHYSFLILQGFLLIQNSSIYPHFPFCQWWKKPSEHDYNTINWPGFTGYMTNEHKTNYRGGFALK